VLWIRIRIHLAVLDPDSYWECGSGSRSMKYDQNLLINLVSCLSKRLLYLRKEVIRPKLKSPTFSKFSCKNLTLCNLCYIKSDQELDPVSHGSTWFWLPESGSESALRKKTGSGSALKSMLIHNTIEFYYFRSKNMS
jgi:hypothetical protein